MKTDALTIGAVGFAAFAAWAYFKSKPAAAAAQNVAVTTAANQRQQVGAAIQQNTDSIYSLFGFDRLTATPLDMGGAGGLKP